MHSEQAVCNAIRGIKLYIKTNCVCFTRQFVIDEEEGRCISVRLRLTYNQITGCCTVYSGLIYCRRHIGPRKNGKQSCKDPIFVQKYSETHLKAHRKIWFGKHNPGVGNVL